MDYRLLYDAGNGYEDLDLGDEVPAMNYQIASLNELKDRRAAYSQRIKLPKTPKNMRLLGFLDSFAVVADAAYTPRRCKLLCEGAQLSPFGAVLYVDNLDDNAGGSIDCQIVSNTVDLFSILGDVDNENMGNILWENVWTSDRIVRDNADASGDMRWPAVFTKQGLSTTDPFSFLFVPTYNLVPCYRFITMIEQLFYMYGYRVESDLLDDPFMKSLYITASKITEDSNVTATYIGKRTRVPAYTRPTTVQTSVELASVQQADVFGGSKSVDYEEIKVNQWQYYAPQPGDYKLEVYIKNVGSYALGGLRKVQVVAIQRISATSQIIHDEILPSTVLPNTTWSLEKEVSDLNMGDMIGFEILIYGGGSLSSEYTTIEVTAQVSLVHEEAAPGIGSRFDYARASGFKTYKELVQTFIQLFGVLVDVVEAPNVSQDGIIGTVRLYSFDELYRRRDAGQYVDWSRKLVINNERNVGFTLANYAQRNIIQLTDNTDDGTHDAGSFSVANRTLTSEKTLFTIAAEAGRDVTYKGNPVAVVPTLKPSLETDEETGEVIRSVITYKGCKSHLLRINENKTFNLAINTGFPVTPITYHPFPQSVTVTMQELIDRYYAPIKRLMGNARTISAYFNLSTLDIAQLDLLTPVWLKPYGCFFYISKIDNFVAGQPTKVELVKMSSNEGTINYYLTLNNRNADIDLTVPYEGGKYRFYYSTNGTLKVSTSMPFIGTINVDGRFIEIVIDRVLGSVHTLAFICSLEEDPSVVRTIYVKQEARPVDPNQLTLKLRTDGTNLYVQTSRPLKTGEGVVIMTRGAGRMAWMSSASNRARDYHPSAKRWHIPYYPYKIEADGKIAINTSSIYIGNNTFRWKVKTDKKGRQFVHIQKGNNSKGFGYKIVNGMNKAVTFAVAVVTTGTWKPEELSNRCYFESRVSYSGGEFTQGFVVTKTL